MEIIDKYKVCTDLLEQIREQLTRGKKSKCVVFTPVPVIPSDMNDDLGCGTSSQLQVGDHGYYITSAVKQKRAVLTQLIEKYGTDRVSSVVCQGNYLRPTEVKDWTHLPYLTQYDWEVDIDAEERTVSTLIKYVNRIWTAVRAVYDKYNSTVCRSRYPRYVTAEQLCRLYPDKIPDDRVRQYMEDKDCDALFVIGIGADLSDGKPHDSRAKDYDDYSTITKYTGSDCKELQFCTVVDLHQSDDQTVTGLNGDLFVRYGQHTKDKVIELMSCGIRVDAAALKRQMGTDIFYSEYHKSIASNKYRLTIGGGLGQERTLMYIFNLDDIQDTYPTLS